MVGRAERRTDGQTAKFTSRRIRNRVVDNAESRITDLLDSLLITSEAAEARNNGEASQQWLALN